MPPTPTQALATLMIGRDVIEWAVERRGDGEPSYRTIATELREMTGGTVDVTDETVRLWCVERELREKHNACPNCSDPTWHNGTPCPQEKAS